MRGPLLIFESDHDIPQIGHLKLYRNHIGTLGTLFKAPALSFFFAPPCVLQYGAHNYIFKQI